MRSAKAVEFLKPAGFKKVRNMKGGILEWVDKIDPSQPKDRGHPRLDPWQE